MGSKWLMNFGLAGKMLATPYETLGGRLVRLRSVKYLGRLEMFPHFDQASSIYSCTETDLFASCKWKKGRCSASCDYRELLYLLLPVVCLGQHCLFRLIATVIRLWSFT